MFPFQDAARDLKKYNYRSYQDVDLKRQFSKFSKLGYAALPDTKYRDLLEAISAMESNYAKVHVCSYKNKTDCSFQLEPEITDIFDVSRDADELKYYWLEWYNKAGTPVREYFDKYVALNKESAVLNSKKIFKIKSKIILIH